MVEILQNCVIFNDKTFGDFALSKELRAERTITLRHGERMIFGRNRDKGLVQIGMKLMVVTLGEGGVTEDDILIHNAHEPNPGIHMMLANMSYPNYPVALGVIRDVPDHTYDDNLRDQVEEVRAHGAYPRCRCAAAQRRHLGSQIDTLAPTLQGSSQPRYP